MTKQSEHKSGFRKRDPKEFDEEVVQIDRVTRVVKGGRKLRFRATVVIGNRRGRVGIGIGKSVEVTGAIQKAIAKAKKTLLDVKLDGTTVPHQVKVKFKAAKLLLMPASPGTGIIAGGTVRKVLELAGINDILSKSYGTKNKLNNTKVTFKALESLQETPRMAKAAAAKKTVKQVEEKAEAPKPAAKPAPKPPVKKAPVKKTES